MAAPVVSDSSFMASQCMAFCQTLASQGKAFKLELKIGETFSFSLDTKKEISSPIPVQKARKVSPSTMKRNALRRQKFLASKNKASAEKVATENPAENSVIQKPSVSCEECSHTIQTVGGMKLHVKNKHSISQIDGNTSLVETIEEETVTKHFSFESLCNFGRLLERLESELHNVKKFELFEKEKVTKKWTRYEVTLTVLKESHIQWPTSDEVFNNIQRIK